MSLSIAPPAMTLADPFMPFGTSHLAALATTLFCIVLLGWLSRQRRQTALRIVESILGCALLSIPVFSAIAQHFAGALSLATSLPLHYCDLAVICGGLGLLTRKHLAVEIVYFFGLAGTLQGLLTPALQYDFPDLRYFHFFLLHGGVVAAALHLVWNLGLRPRPWSIARMLGVTVLYSAIAMLVNWLTGANYGFFCEKPANPSMIDHLGPWPWYIASLLGVAIAFYTVLDIPFWRGRMKAAPSHPPA